MRKAITWWGVSALLGSLLLGSCCPEDPRDHPARMFEFNNTDVDRYRAVAGFRTREEFIEMCVHRLKVEIDEARRSDPKTYREWVVDFRERDQRIQRGQQ